MDITEEHYRHILDRNWGLLRNTYLCQYFDLKKSKQLKEAFPYLLATIYYDLSGMENNNRVCTYKSLKWIFKTSLWIEIGRCIKKLDINDTVLTSLFLETAHSLTTPPFSYFTPDTMIHIILDELRLIQDQKQQDRVLKKYKSFANIPSSNSSTYYFVED